MAPRIGTIVGVLNFATFEHAEDELVIPLLRFSHAQGLRDLAFLMGDR